MSYDFTAEDVAREAIKLAANNPDAVYVGDGGRCFYTRGQAAGRPGCLFGQALGNLGVENLDRFDRFYVVGLGIADVLRELGITVSTYDTARLEDTQSRQDDGHTWSEAVEPLAAMLKGTDNA